MSILGERWRISLTEKERPFPSATYTRCARHRGSHARHWAGRARARDAIERSLKQNIAAIAGEFHTHRLYGAFHDTFGEMIDGFVGQYELCVAMAEALTAWEAANGMGEAYENAGVPWIEVVEDFVSTVLDTAVESGVLPDPVTILPALQVFGKS